MPRASHLASRTYFFTRTDVAFHAASLLASCITAVLLVAAGPALLRLLDRDQPTAWLLIGSGSVVALAMTHWIAASVANWLRERSRRDATVDEEHQRRRREAALADARVMAEIARAMEVRARRS